MSSIPTLEIPDHILFHLYYCNLINQLIYTAVNLNEGE